MPSTPSELNTDISVDEFRALFSRHPGAVCVVTMGAPEDRRGFTATSVISISAQPPMLAFSVIKGSSSWDTLLQHPRLGVHFLAAGQEHIAQQFAQSNTDRFAGIDVEHGDLRPPLISDVPTWAIGTVATITELDTNALITVRIEESSTAEDHDSLVYRNREYGRVTAQ